jgi:hypothetical protein
MATKKKGYTLIPLTKSQELPRFFQKWKEANEEYLRARFAYDQARLIFKQRTEALRTAFEAAKQRVKAATEAYYAFLQVGQPLTLTQLEESKLFTPEQLSQLKGQAQLLIQNEKKSRA